MKRKEGYGEDLPFEEFMSGKLNKEEEKKVMEFLEKLDAEKPRKKKTKHQKNMSRGKKRINHIRLSKRDDYEELLIEFEKRKELAKKKKKLRNYKRILELSKKWVKENREKL